MSEETAKTPAKPRAKKPVEVARYKLSKENAWHLQFSEVHDDPVLSEYAAKKVSITGDGYWMKAGGGDFPTGTEITITIPADAVVK